MIISQTKYKPNFGSHDRISTGNKGGKPLIIMINSEDPIKNDKEKV